MIVYTHYPFDNRVRREAETLASCGYFSVTVLCLKENRWPRTYIRENVTVRELNSAKYGGKGRMGYALSYAHFLLRAWVRCTHLFLRGVVDIVHVHNMPNLLVLSSVVPKLFGRKVILDMHDSAPDLALDKFYGRAGFLYKLLCIEERLGAMLSDCILFVNQVQKEVSLQRGLPQEKASVFMNVPDHRWFKEPEWLGRKREDGKENGLNIVYHGTVTRRLGIDLAIDAVGVLKNRIPDIRLHLWERGGDYLKQLWSQQDELGAESFVVIHPVVPIEEIPGVMISMDIGIIPYGNSAANQVMLPVKMMEYVALGIPVVAPRLRAIQHYFNDRMVSFYEPGNVEQMADAIWRLYLDENLKKSQVRSARGFLEEYGWEKKSAEFIQFYMEMAK